MNTAYENKASNAKIGINEEIHDFDKFDIKGYELDQEFFLTIVYIGKK